MTNLKTTATCRSCGAQIVWFKTDKGKNIPIDAHTVEPGDEQLDLKRHAAHFSTCPFAKEHRRSR